MHTYTCSYKYTGYFYNLTVKDDCSQLGEYCQRLPGWTVEWISNYGFNDVNIFIAVPLCILVYGSLANSASFEERYYRAQAAVGAYLVLWNVIVFVKNIISTGRDKRGLLFYVTRVIWFIYTIGLLVCAVIWGTWAARAAADTED